ncbi:hypothetical protein QYM36_007219, partial [Artemia franciscana]
MPCFSGFLMADLLELIPSPVFACFVDAKAAFDQVNLEKLLGKEDTKGVDRRIIGTLQYCESFRVLNDVRQGGLLSSLLYNLHADDLNLRLVKTGVGCFIGGVGFNNLSCADNLVIIAPTVAALNHLLSICDEFASANDIVFNTAKTQCMAFIPQGTPLKHIPMAWPSGVSLPFLGSYEYLRFTVAPTLSDELHVKALSRSLCCRGNILIRIQWLRGIQLMDDDEIYELCDTSWRDDLQGRKRRQSQPSKKAQLRVAKPCSRLSNSASQPSKKVKLSITKPCSRLSNSASQPSKKVKLGITKPCSRLLNSASQPSKKAKLGITKPCSRLSNSISQAFKTAKPDIAEDIRPCVVPDSYSTQSSPIKELDGNAGVGELINSEVSALINVDSGLSGTAKAIFIREWIENCQTFSGHVESHGMQLDDQLNPTEAAREQATLLQESVHPVDSPSIFVDVSQEFPPAASVSQMSSSMAGGQQSIKSYFTVKKIAKSDVMPTKEAATKIGGSVNNSKTAWSSLMAKMQDNQRKDKRLPCPPFKLIKGTPFAVDAFSYGSLPGVTAYFLSHFHYDHYIGLTRRFSSPIYCSKITGKLAILKLGLSPASVRIIDLNQTITLDNIDVTALESNHCPGAVMFLFKLPTGRRILHTGDFRACEEMEKISILREEPIEAVYLDTTFCDDFYNFPLQKKVIDVAVAIAEKKYNMNKKLLIVVGSYMI